MKIQNNTLCIKCGNRQFASDFTEFVNKECSKELSCMDLDTILFKRAKNAYKLIETKHTLENMPETQKELLVIIGRMLDFASNHPDSPFKGYSVETLKLIGNPPYNNITVKNLISGQEQKILGDNVKKWVEFQFDKPKVILKKQMCICEHFKSDHNLNQFNCHAYIQDKEKKIYICECRLFQFNAFQSED